ncbi:hypothetical protein ACWDRB_63645 [Nonomuraea sp. NPDC003707]
MLGAQQALAAADHYRTALACELVAAVRALRLRGMRLDDHFDDLEQETTDRDLTADIAAAARLLPKLAEHPREMSLVTSR